MQATNATPKFAIKLSDLEKRYLGPQGGFLALSGINYQFEYGEMVAVTGKSGSGKSTMLNLLTGIDHPSAGSIEIQDQRINQMNERDLARWRGKTIGIVFQFFQLMPSLSIAENVMLPMDFCEVHPRRERRDIALRLLDQMGIADQADKYPSALSGGQQQRAAIARSLANDPPIICADEPTGNLDSQTGGRILEIFQNMAKLGKTVILVSHQSDIESLADRSIRLVDGKILTAQTAAVVGGQP